MKSQETFEEFAIHVDAELRRGYVGQLAPENVAAAVNRAVGHAWNQRRRMVSVANPVGYLYRIGLESGDIGPSEWLPWSEDGAAPDVHPALPPALEELPPIQATALWLVRACGWTNVQTAEALGIGPATVSSRVAEGMIRLGASLGNAANDVDVHLRALSDHRVANIPEELVIEEAEPEATPARTPTWAMVRVMQRALALIVVLGLIGGTVLVIRAVGGADVEAPTLPTVTLSMSDRQLISRSDWARPLGQSGQPGTFALARAGAGFDTIEVAVPDRARKPFLPASTFKILNSLIILETDTVTSVDSNVAWDGVIREFDAWNQDHSLRTALAVSAVWVFQELARQVGDEQMAQYVAAADYGNSDTTGDIDSFWLEGALRTSAIDQLGFLERLTLGALPFDPAHQAAVRDILVVEEGPGWTIRYKTGTALGSEPALGWLVGIVDTDDGQWVFAYNVDLNTAHGDAGLEASRDRLDLVKELLASADVIDR